MVVIGGMGSILGSAVVGVALGVLEGFTKFLYPQASNLVVFLVMIIVLLIKPAGLFGRETGAVPHALVGTGGEPLLSRGRMPLVIAAAIALLAVAPFMIYPVFLIKLCCFALFACAFNLLIGFTGLLSFGHAAFFGFASYVTGWFVKAQGWTPELALLAGTAAAGALGLLFGALAIRRQGIYFAMITMALAQMFYFFALQAPFTGGEDGLSFKLPAVLQPSFELFEEPVLGVMIDGKFLSYYLLFAVELVLLLALLRIVNSP
ncbi:MAG: ABC transporter permease subunit, partial [Gammaproteobacteria bacterium]